jgi:hypothetical protein
MIFLPFFFGVGHAALPPAFLRALEASPELYRCYVHLTRDLGVDDAQAGLVAMYLRSSNATEGSRKCASLTTKQEVDAISEVAPGEYTGKDGTPEGHTKNQDAGSEGQATNKAGSAVGAKFTLLGDRVQGVPVTFVSKVTAKNPSKVARYRFTADLGTVLLVTQDPAKYQYTVIVRGTEFTLQPGETRSDYVWTMCIDHNGELLPFGLELVVGGKLPDVVLDTMTAYMAGTDEMRLESREKTIKMLRMTIAAMTSP